VIPPNLLSEVVHRTTDAAERKKALDTLAATNQFIGGRRAVSALPQPARAPGAKFRLVYDAHSRTRLPGGIVRREGQPALRDAAVDESFAAAGVTYDFFQQVFGRNSLDGKGLILSSTCHYGKGYDNAFWNGAQMIYGDGDGKLFGRFTAALDVVAHELAHGFTQYTSDLDYQDQSGALNEHLSDVFGVMVKMWLTGAAAETYSWVVGEGLFAPGVHGVGLRSMKAPGTAYDDPLLGKDAQPARMGGYVVTDDDNGGVHINSGIPNHAFYLACAAAGGRPWEGVGRVWYEVAARQLWADATFQDMADLTTRAAATLFPDRPALAAAVRDGWRAVDITPA
jgi:Zn-dependent metalloprotease